MDQNNPQQQNNSQPDVQSQPPVAQPPAPQPSNQTPTEQSKGLAVTSLVLAIIGFLTGWLIIGLLFAIIAVILGIVSLVKKSGGKGMSIAGIIIGGITILFGILLVPIIIVAYSGIQTRAEATSIAESASQIRLKAEAYNAILSSDDQSYYPTFEELIEGTELAPEAQLDSALSAKVHKGSYESVSANKPISYLGCPNGAFISYYDPAEDDAETYTVGQPSSCDF